MRSKHSSMREWLERVREGDSFSGEAGAKI